MRLFITRHGETFWNSIGMIQGWKDSPLTDQGIIDAHALRDRLMDQNFDYIFSSDLPRAVETASILRGERVQTLFKDKRLREIRLDEWQGMEVAKLRELHGESLRAYKEEPGTWRFKEAETLWDLTDRVRSFVEDLPEDGENILIVSHGVTIRALKLVLFGGTVPDFWKGTSVPGTSLTIGRKEGDGWVLELEHCEEHKGERRDHGKSYIG